MRFLRSAAFLAAIIASASAQEVKKQSSKLLPDGTGKEQVLKLCSGCHEMELVITRPRTRLGWEENIEDMVARGVKGTDDELDAVVNYLTDHFGRININTASAVQMQTVLGFTTEEAESVLEHRKAHGKIPDFEQLKTVKGLDPAKLKAKRASIAYER